MKQPTLLLYSLFLISCNQTSKKQNRDIQRPDRADYATGLINNYFLKYADSSRVDSLKIQLKNSFDIYDDENLRIVHIDAEELSEFSFDFFLPGVNKILAKRDMNMKLSAQKLNHNDNSYDVLINNDTIQLYTQKELDAETFWDSAPRNFFRKVNETLKAKNNDEQFYLLYGGNDLHAILLTDKQFSIISDYYRGYHKDIPYKP